MPQTQPFMVLLVYGLFLLISAVQVFYSYRIRKRFSFRFVRMFFFFVVAYTAFNFLNLSSKILYVSVFSEKEGLFTLLAALFLYPLMAAVFFSFLLLADSLGPRPIPQWVRSLFWIGHGAVFILLFLSVLAIVDTGFTDISRMSVRMFIVISSLSLICPALWMGLQKRAGRDEKTLAIGRILGFYFLAAFALLTLLIDLFHFPFRFFGTLSHAYYFISMLMVAVPVPALVFLSGRLKKNWISHPDDGETPPRPKKRLEGLPLTPRELDIINLVLEGKTNQEIGRTLFISTKTVKNNLTEIFRKLELKNRVQLVSFLLSGTDSLNSSSSPKSDI
ncbi:MAG: Transcriptional regulatory protein LiaR [Candidatus Aminicenantes bacterium ADurb.Bin147]|nr:MAG: Transcriptional regulatory protein LiaR [Candidatus Aminicenantes bacterium ADurb.Bin147]